MSDLLETHYKMVIKAIIEGRLIPFLGAGANLCDRPAAKKWQHGQFDFLPNSSELALHLANNYHFPASDMQVQCPSCKTEIPPSIISGNPSSEKNDLARVSQYVAVMAGPGPLNDELRKVFNADYPPTSLHKFFATLPAFLRKKGYHPYQLIVTTNYDDVLESAFKTAGELFDLVTYVAEGDHSGKFVHRLSNGKMRPIDKPNKDLSLSLDQRSVILKIHGAVDRVKREQDSYVITEDHYIDYLVHEDVLRQIPLKLRETMKWSHFLFLGYGLRDWNLRVLLRRMWREQEFPYNSWAIQLNPKPIEQKFWLERGVEIYDKRLEDYLAELNERLQALSHIGGGM